MDAAGEIHVLHVDDEPEFADTAADFLEHLDGRFTVTTATSAAAGLERLAEGRIDCIVSDYDMPGRTGIEFLDSVRKDNPDLPFILFTGKGSEDVASDAISVGVTDYLQKERGREQYELLANKIRNAVERYRAEQARQRHLAAIESAREGISILNADGEFIYVNQAYADLYGYEPADLRGEHWELLYPDDEVSVARTEILPTVTEEGYWHGESTGLRADGSTFPEDHIVSRTEDGDLVCTVRDLTDRRERETEIHLKNRAMDEAPIGITISDPSEPDNPLIYANERFEELTGYEENDVVGRNCRFLQGEGTTGEPVAAMREAIDAGEPVTVELRNYRKDGTEFWNRVSIAPIADASGTPLNWVGFQEDVTERKETERELRQYERIVDTMQEAACIYDADGRFAVVNDYLAEFYGTTPAALVGERSNLIPRIRADADGDPYQELLDGERSEIRGEIEGEFPGRGREIVSYRLTPLVLDGAVEGVVGVAREVTQHRDRERELEAKNEQLEAFASIVSHDLRNPLAIADGRLELAREEHDSENLAAVARALDRMEVLIEDLLTLAREREQITDTEALTLVEVVNDCWRNVETAAATLTTRTDQRIEADPSRLKQLLENLFRNAVEHGGSDVTITVGALADGFYVADDGSGIPVEERETVFETGYSTAAHGTGFGLNIVREIVEAHDWRISITDSEAGGARFEITDVDVVES